MAFLLRRRKRDYALPIYAPWSVHLVDACRLSTLSQPRSSPHIYISPPLVAIPCADRLGIGLACSETLAKTALSHPATKSLLPLVVPRRHPRLRPSQRLHSSNRRSYPTRLLSWQRERCLQSPHVLQSPSRPSWTLAKVARNPALRSKKSNRTRAFSASSKRPMDHHTRLGSSLKGHIRGSIWKTASRA